VAWVGGGVIFAGEGNGGGRHPWRGVTLARRSGHAHIVCAVRSVGSFANAGDEWVDVMALLCTCVEERVSMN
jgi:hypothetical protein